MNQDLKRWSIGIIGYGEVGRILAEDLRKTGLHIVAYDAKLETGSSTLLRDHAGAHRVALAASHAGAVAKADLVISAVTASETVAVAEECARHIKLGSFFLDLNSASPGAKKNASHLIERTGGRYVEGAVMTSVPPYRIRVPLLLGGPYAENLKPMLNEIGFASKVASETVGVASAVKMCRSIMIKGLEAMVIESFTTARAYDVEDAVIASLVETFPGIEWEEQAAYFFQRVIQHGHRRAEEMREVEQTVREAGLVPWSANGTVKRQAWVAELADAGLFGTRGGEHFARSGDWRTEADRILRSIKRKDDNE